MAVRIRMDNRTIVCAAKSEERPGDTYINDRLHYVFGVEMCVLSVCGYDDNGAELWEFHAPITLDEKIDKEEALKAIEEIKEKLLTISTNNPPCLFASSLLSVIDLLEKAESFIVRMSIVYGQQSKVKDV